jgi:hypothetical protein
MAPHALVLSALHALILRRLPTTGKALAASTTLGRDEVVLAVRNLSQRGLVRFVGAEARLTLEGFAVAASLAARRVRRGQVHVLVPRADAKVLQNAA